MTIKLPLNPSAGFVAIAPNGKIIGFANSPTALIEALREILPEDAENYDDTISEGGTWFTFLEFLTIYGMEYLATTPAAMAALKASDHTAEYECDIRLGKLWMKGEPSENFEPHPF